MSKSFVYLIILLTFLLIPLVNGETQVQTLGTFEQNTAINLIQNCQNSTYSNITRIFYPNSSLAINEQTKMTALNQNYNYTFSLTSQLGNYLVYGFCDENGIVTNWVYDFSVTESGEQFGTDQSFILLGQLGLAGLLFGIGLTFRKEKWKLRTLFFMFSLLMGLIFLNSIRIVIGTSSSLALMGSLGLILGIVILSFMFMYLFIYATIEAFQYFKDKKKMRWDVNTP